MYIQGIDVILYTTEEIGRDEFDAPIYDEVPIIVKNVLPIQPSTDEATNEMNLTGKRASYVLCIPKGDKNDWEDKEVEFFDERFRTIGHVTQYIEKLVPGDWNKKIMVERYE